MCAPAAAPIALGVAQAGVGVMGAVGQHQSQQAQVNASNANAKATYRQQLANTNYRNAGLKANYSLQQSQAREQYNENNLSAQRAYTNEQRRVNESMKSAAFSKQDMLIDLMRKQGTYATTGQTGKSFDRMEGDVLGQFGRNQSVLAANLMNVQQSQSINNRSIRSQLLSDNNKVFSKVAVAPQLGIAPPKPVMQQGPSGLSLLAGIGGAAVNGFGTYNELKAPSPTA